MSEELPNGFELVKQVIKILAPINPAMLDIGASIGDSWGSYFYGLNWTCLFVEPHPAYYKRLVELHPDSVCLNVACSFESGLKEILFTEEGTASTMAAGAKIDKCVYNGKVSEGIRTGEGVFWNYKPLGIRTVLCLTMDEILEEHSKFKPSVIKVDTEGYELEVLQGFNFNHRPKLFILEQVPETQWAGMDKVAAVDLLLIKHGYKLAGYADRCADALYVCDDEALLRIKPLLVKRWF